MTVTAFPMFVHGSELPFTGVSPIPREIEKTDIKRGMVIAKPGSITPHNKFKAEVYILKKEEGIDQ